MTKTPKENKTEQGNKSGQIISYFSGVGKIKGLPQVFLDEVLLDKSGSPVALVIGFEKDYVKALFLRKNPDLEKPIFRSKKVFSVPISNKIIGRIINGLAQPLDNLGAIRGDKMNVFRQAPPIIDREPVSSSLSTGIKTIDTVLSLGRGQRELIIGDRKLGKSTLAQDVVLNQKEAEPPVFCVYVLCGQKEKKLQNLISLFKKNNAFLYTTVVAATAEDTLAAQYLAPFVGTTIGEKLRNLGEDVLIIYDDLSKHAKTYRNISLLQEQPPGREAYPGNIFSLHAELLERSGKLSEEKGGGSLTALPIIETQQGDITSFIPTNLISITDGQIYLEQGLFQKGFLPAVNVGLSVSRVGSQAQPEPLKEVVEGIRLALSQHKQLQKLTQLETSISEKKKEKIHRGELIMELLKQDKHTKVTWPQQVVLFYAMENGFFDEMQKEDWKSFEKVLLELIRNLHFDLLEKIKGGKFDEEIKQEIEKIIKNAKEELLT